MGRKPLGDVGKTHMMHTRMTQSERAEIDSAAAAAGLSTSAWVRDLLLAAARASVAAALAAKPAKKSPKSAKKSG